MRSSAEHSASRMRWAALQAHVSYTVILNSGSPLMRYIIVADSSIDGSDRMDALANTRGITVSLPITARCCSNFHGAMALRLASAATLRIMRLPGSTWIDQRQVQIPVAIFMEPTVCRIKAFGAHGVLVYMSGGCATRQKTT